MATTSSLATVWLMMIRMFASHRSLSGADFGPPVDLEASADYVVAARDGEAFVVSTSGNTVVAFHFE